MDYAKEDLRIMGIRTWRSGLRTGRNGVKKSHGIEQRRRNTVVTRIMKFVSKTAYRIFEVIAFESKA